MKNGIVIVIALLGLVGIYYFFFMKKTEASPSQDQTKGTEQATSQLADVFPAPTVQNSVNTRPVPSQIGLDQMGMTSETSSKDAVKSLVAGDFISEDSLRALNTQLHSVIQTNVGNPITDATGGQKVRVEQPDNVNVDSLKSMVGSITNTAGAEKGNPKQLINIGAWAKSVHRPIVNGRVVIAGHHLNPNYKITKVTLEKLLRSEKLGS